MPTRHIITMSIRNPSTGELRLLPAATDVNRGDTMTWIKDRAIDSFLIVAKHSNTAPIFTTSLPGQVTSLDVIVRSGAPFGDWFYSVIWKDAATHTSHSFDPKISVNPHANLGSSQLIPAAGVLGFAMLSAFLLIRLKKVCLDQMCSRLKTFKQLMPIQQS